MRNRKLLQRTVLFNLIIFVSCFSPVYISAQKTADKKLTPREIAQQTLPSTVLLVMNNSETEEIKSGSGFFVAEDVVVTNFHVIKNTTEGYAKIYGQEKIYEILGIIGLDEENDLALLKIKGIKGKPLKLNTDDSIAIGDEVFAVGNPKGLEGTFSQGIVSSIRKTDTKNLLQITASISSGSSGGAILDEKGDVVGVAVGAIESGQSLNFAIPVLLLRNLMSKKNLLKSLASYQVGSKSKKSVESGSNKLPETKFPKTKPTETKPSKLQENTLNWTSLKMFGRVSSTKTDYYLLTEKFGELVIGEPVATSIERFNLEGYRIFNEDVVFKKEGLEETYSKSDFDKFGKKEFPFTTRTEYFYDYKKNQETYKSSVKCASCKSFRPSSGFINIYNTNEKITYLPDGELLSKEVTEYVGNEVIEYDYDNKGRLFGKTIETKTRDEKILKQYFITVDSFLDDTKEAELELSFHLIFQDERTQDTEKSTIIEIKDGKQSVSQITIQNLDTDLILYQEKNGKIVKYSYEFDKQGNWIKQTEFKQ
ncbi:MAG: S1C family serine protease, partial [Aridibacter sp.]